MLKTGLTLSWIVLLAITTASQQPVVTPGQPEELKGVTRLYVNAANKAARDNIIAEIKKRLPQLTFAERSEDAEVRLLFSIQSRSFPKGDPTSGLTSSAAGTTIQYELVASGAVIKPVTKESAHRLFEFRDTSETTLSFPEQALSAKFARGFVESYRKVNP